MLEMGISNKPIKELNATQSMVLSALMFAAAIVLSIVENMLPPIVVAVPGVKFGLSNIAVMYALFFLGKKQAYTIAILKGLFAFITRGAIAALLSVVGGLLSITIMLVLLIIFKNKISYLVISICGAISHNVGQFIVVALLYVGTNMLAYLPVLLVSGVFAGIVTSTLLRIILPALKRLV
ncbi:MAG: Gx transporter family protein [Anaerovoracaceae bacterium]|jgi:heptaprenyl diphosphate synthase